MVLPSSISSTEEFQFPHQENHAQNTDIIGLHKKTYVKFLAQNLAQRAQSMRVHTFPLSF